jgi:hypothetical protein
MPTLIRSLSPAAALLAGATALAGAQAAPAADSVEHRPHARIVAVQVDSMSIHVTHDSTRAGLFVETPDGTFLGRGDSETIARWAESAATLPAPQRVEAHDGEPAQLSMSGVMLREAGNATAMRLVRRSVPAGDSLPAYQLDASNGAWGGALRLTPTQAARLFDALRGTAAPTPEETERRAYLPWQVSEPVKRLGGPIPVFPADVDARHRNATVYMTFIVAADGRAEPSSINALGDPIPQLALAVRESVLKSRYRPAKKDGVVVRQLAQQAFSFEER